MDTRVDVCECGNKKTLLASMCRECWNKRSKQLSKERMESVCACGRKKHHTSKECHICRKERILKIDSATHKFDKCSCGNIKRKDVSQCRECFFRKKREEVRYCNKCGALLTSDNQYPSTARNGGRVCKTCERIHAKESNSKWKEHRKEIAAELKREIMDAYGGRCNCCGENRIEFLSIDHVHGDGRTHRKTLPGNRLYAWLKKEKFPKDNFQCLCMNCNFAKRHNSTCPHELERQRVQQA